MEVTSADKEQPGLPTDNRILGLDLARAFAIVGMALIHFAIVLSTNELKTSLGQVIDHLAGRPATAFMILAGIGVSLQCKRSLDRTRQRLRRRGLFFFLVGYLNLVLWPGDILRVYGVAYFVAIWFATTSTTRLCASIVGVVTLFVSLVVAIDFETNWDFATLHCANLWTPSGAALNLFYNGFRAVLPWIGVFFLGMLIGRLDLRSSVVLEKLIVWGTVIWVATETVSFALLRRLRKIEDADLDTINALFGTDSLPPMPLFLLSSCGFATAGIAFCILISGKSGADNGKENAYQSWLHPIASAGQMAFSWYILHIFVVIAVGIMADFRGDWSMSASISVSALFAFVMFGTSHVYRKRFQRGPLEWTLRAVDRS